MHVEKHYCLSLLLHVCIFLFLFHKPSPLARSDARPPRIQNKLRSWVRFSCPAKYSFVEIGHEIISTAILSLPLIQSVYTGERMCTRLGLSLPRKSVVRFN